MKTRLGFVSNSSSSSFIVKKKNLTEAQIKAIKEHKQFAEIVDKHMRALAVDLKTAGYDLDYLNLHQLSELIRSDWAVKNCSYFGYKDRWDVFERDNDIVLSCTVDNFDLERFLNYIDVDSKEYKCYPDEDFVYNLKNGYPIKE